MRWNPWACVGLAILAPVTVGVMLAAGLWANEPESAPPVVTAAAASAGEPQAKAEPQEKPTAEHVRELQQALATAGYDPGPVDGIFGPRTKSALRKYIAVPPPHVPSASDQALARFRSNERRESP